MSEEFAISASKIEKKYKLYERNRDRVLDAFGLTGKKQRFKYPHFSSLVPASTWIITVSRISISTEP